MSAWMQAFLWTAAAVSVLGTCATIWLLERNAFRREDDPLARLMAKDIARLPVKVYEKRTVWIDGEPSSVRVQVQPPLDYDLSLTRFEKDEDHG